MSLFEVVSSDTAMPNKAQPRPVGAVFDDIGWIERDDGPESILDTEDDDHKRRLRKNIEEGVRATSGKDAESATRAENAESGREDKDAEDLKKAKQRFKYADDPAGIGKVAVMSQIWAAAISIFRGKKD